LILLRTRKKGIEWAVLRDLAHDLEFYEPDPKLCAEDPSYFGDQVAEAKIVSALKKIRP